MITIILIPAQLLLLILLHFALPKRSSHKDQPLSLLLTSSLSIIQNICPSVEPCNNNCICFHCELENGCELPSTQSKLDHKLLIISTVILNCYPCCAKCSIAEVDKIY